MVLALWFQKNGHALADEMSSALMPETTIFFIDVKLGSLPRVKGYHKHSHNILIMKWSYRRQQGRQGQCKKTHSQKNTKSLHSHFASVLILFVWGGGVEREQPIFKKKKKKTTTWQGNEMLKPINTHQSMRWLCFNCLQYPAWDRLRQDKRYHEGKYCPYSSADHLPHLLSPASSAALKEARAHDRPSFAKTHICPPWSAVVIWSPSHSPAEALQRSRSWVYWFCESQLAVGHTTKGLAQDIKPDWAVNSVIPRRETNWSHSNRCFSCFMNCNIITSYRHSFCLLKQTCIAVRVKLFELTDNLAEDLQIAFSHSHNDSCFPFA